MIDTYLVEDCNVDIAYIDKFQGKQVVKFQKERHVHINFFCCRFSDFAYKLLFTTVGDMFIIWLLSYWDYGLFILTLPMLRQLSSKAEGRRDF